MSLCDFSFDSSVDFEVAVSGQVSFFPSKDVILPWKFNHEHLLREKKDIYSWLTDFQWWRIPPAFSKLFQW